jgi:hypothetical protein
MATIITPTTYLDAIGVMNSGRVPNGHFTKMENRKQFLYHLGNHLGFTRVEDWKRIRVSDIRRFGGGGLLSNYYKDSPYALLKDCIEGFIFKEYEMESIPQGVWKKHDNVRSWLEGLMIKKGWSCMDDLYKLQQSDFIENGGGGLLDRYVTYLKVLQFAYPDTEWILTKFKNLPNGYWTKIENCKAWMDNIMKQKGWSSMDDLYLLQPADFTENHGHTLLSRYKNSILNVLEAIYPEVTWYPFLFKMTTLGWFMSEENRFIAFKWFEQKLGITSPEEWYDVCSQSLFLESEIVGILRYYDASPIQLIKSVYPFLKWYKFKRVERSSWSSKEKINEWFYDLCQHYNISDMEQVYSLTAADIHAFAGLPSSSVGKSYINLIVNNIDYHWDVKKFVKSGFSKASCNFMDNLSRALNTPIRHKLNNKLGEKRIPQTRFSVDGFIEETNTIIEFHGCLFHGCPICFTKRDDVPWFNKRKTYGMLYNTTVSRTAKLRSIGYRVIEIWECQTNSITDYKYWFDSSCSA